MQLEALPTNLSRLPAPCPIGDPDGVRERRVFALLLVDIVGAARLALQIENRYRRAVWLRGFRPSTIAAAQNDVLELATVPAERDHAKWT